MARRGTAASINLAELEKLAAMQCTDEEIAAWFNVSSRTIERRRKSPVFAETIVRGKAKGRISLRRAQLKILEQGNATMGIWLGKQYLEQADQIDVNTSNQTIVLVIPATQREEPERPMTLDISPEQPQYIDTTSDK
jgi:precorrin-4 methylase